MRSFGKFLGRVLAALIVVAALLTATVWLWPAEAPLRLAAYDATLPDDLDAHLAAREAVFDDLTPGTQKRIVWAGTPGEKTPLALIYLHGFSSTSEEVRPVPDRVAAALGANLYFARLAGHGRTGTALAGATAEDWLTDLAEALAIGTRIGERVILLGTSTGATLATIGLGDPSIAAALPGADRVAGIAMISPNFRVRNIAARLLDLPLVEVWGTTIAGSERAFTPVNADHARFWTTAYPTPALYPMARLVRAARTLDPHTIRTPALFIWTDADQVVDPAATADVAARWQGPVTTFKPTLAPGDDPYSHVIAGDILSPGTTATVIDTITTWARGLR